MSFREDFHHYSGAWFYFITMKRLIIIAVYLLFGRKMKMCINFSERYFQNYDIIRYEYGRGMITRLKVSDMDPNGALMEFTLRYFKSNKINRLLTY